jgi:hypothetical protein
MKTMPDMASRRIRIACHPDAVLKFLGDAESLPAWTSFYKRCLGRERGGLRFETPLGESVTRVEIEHAPRGGRATIVSVFAERTERAEMLIEPSEEGDSALASKVTFFVTFPDHVPPERRRTMLGQIEFELVRLKRGLEAEATRASMLQAVP